jgi:hypothetical protein
MIISGEWLAGPRVATMRERRARIMNLLQEGWILLQRGKK